MNKKTCCFFGHSKIFEDKQKLLCLLCEKIEEKLLRFAIKFRNQKMVEMSDFCIFYVKKSYGGALQAMKYAKGKKRKFLNLG